MAWIYLIGEMNTPGKFKIGLTKAKDVTSRLKKLQTGNGEELYISKKYETETPYKLEKMLHMRFQSKHLFGEWYQLTNEDHESFIEMCERLQNTINSLKDNPFFNMT